MAYLLLGGVIRVRVDVPWDDSMHLHAVQHAVGGAVLLPVKEVHAKLFATEDSPRRIPSMSKFLQKLGKHTLVSDICLVS